MRHGLARLLAILILGLSAGGIQAQVPDWPPEPDFKLQKNYPAWFEQTRGESGGEAWRELKRLSAGCPAGTSLAAWLGVNEPPAAMAWNPTADAAAEKVYQATRVEVGAFVRAARRGSGAAPFEYRRPPRVKGASLSALSMPAVESTMAFSRAALKQAWRSRTATPSAKSLLAAIGGVLDWADRVAVGGTPAELNAAAALRRLACMHAQAAVAGGVFDAAALDRLNTMLTRGDFAAADRLCAAVRLESARLYDVLQANAGAGPTDQADRERADVRSALERCDKALSRPLSSKTRETLGRTLNSLKESTSIADLLVDLEAMHAAALEAEAWRRGVHVAAALAIARRNGDAWPASLDELGEKFAEERTDPYSGSPFVYRVSGEIALLYSVGPGGSSTGGPGDTSLVFLGRTRVAPAGPARKIALAEVTRDRLGEQVEVCATVLQVSRKPSRTRKQIYIVTLEEGDARVELVYWEDLAIEMTPEQTLGIGDRLCVRAKVSEFRGKMQLTLLAAGDLKKLVPGS